MKRARWLGALALTTFGVTLASAQATGGLKIRVIDNSDKSEVSGAAVTLSSTNKLVATTSVTTDLDGIALFPVLRAGSGYVVTVTMDGYAGIRQDAVVTNGTTKDIAIALAPEHVEKVVVTEDRGEQVDLDSNETSTEFSSDFIADLPIAGRFYQNVLSLVPGVQDPDKDGNPNVNGARERDFKTQVGGISNVDPLTGTFLNLVTTDSIEALTVITAGAGAEFGRAQGGFAQIIQKQGSNGFEGVFGMLYASKLLDGNGATNIPDNLIPDFYLYQPSLQVSGPIVKDKLWYRLSQELIRREDPVVFAAGGDVDTLGTRRFSTDNQLTWQVSNRNKIALNFRADPLTQTNVGISAVTSSRSSERVETGGPTYALTWTAPYSPSLLVDSTVAYQDSQLSFTPMARGVPNNCVPGSSFLSPYQCFDVSGGAVSGSSLRDWHDSRQRLTVRSDATYYKGRMWGAIHQFKLGLIVENERYFRTLERRPNLLKSPGLAVGGGVTVTNYNITASLAPFSRQRALGNTWGIYGEDILRPIPNLSITLGLRVERESITANGYQPLDPQGDSDTLLAATPGWTPLRRLPVMFATFVAYEDRVGSKAAVEAQLGIAMADGAFYAQNSLWQRYRQPGNVNIDNLNLSPRLSIGWDPWNDGKTKLSISAGRFYDKIFLGVVTAESEPVLANFQIRVVRDTFPTTIAFNPTFNYSFADRNLKTPYNDEYSFKVERRFLQENTISLTYIHRNFKDQLQDVNVNQAPGDWGRCAIALAADDDPMVRSPGTPTLTDPYTGIVYQDTDPGDGDGILDDCTGNIERIVPIGDDGEGTGNPIDVQRPDTVADYYVLNPAWGNIFRIGNVNTSKYDGVTIEYVRRQYKNWQMEASYTWSKATGDAEDFNLALGDDRSTLQDEPGYLSYDRRHSLKVNATCLTPWGFRLGGTAQWESGLPYSLLYRDASQSAALPPYGEFSQPFTSVRTRYVTHQRNDQRNPSGWNFDVKIVKEINLPKGMNLELDANVFNLLNEDTYSVYNNFTKSGQQVNGTNDAQRRFGRTYQVGMRLAF